MVRDAGFWDLYLFGCALTLLLPTYLIRVAGASVTQAGLVTSIASMSTLPGCVLAVLLTRRGPCGPGRR
jgi:hypothetical protein